MGALPGPVFFGMAYRLSAYQGVMAARAAEQEEAQAPAAHGGAEPRMAPSAAGPTPRAVLQNDAAFAGVFSFSEVRT